MRTKTRPISSHMSAEEGMDTNMSTANLEPSSTSLALLAVPNTINSLLSASSRTQEDSVALERAKRSPVLDFFVTDNGSEEMVSTSTCSANTDSEEMEEDDDEEEVDLMRLAVAAATAANKSPEMEPKLNLMNGTFLTRGWNGSALPYPSGPPTFSPFGISAGFYPPNLSTCVPPKIATPSGLQLPAMLTDASYQSDTKLENLNKNTKANALPGEIAASLTSNLMLAQQRLNEQSSLPNFQNIPPFNTATLTTSRPVSMPTTFEDLSNGLTNSFVGNFGGRKSAIAPLSGTYFEKLAPPNFIASASNCFRNNPLSSSTASFYKDANDILTNTLASNSLFNDLRNSLLGDSLLNRLAPANTNLTDHLNMSSSQSSPKPSPPTLLNSTCNLTRGPFGPPAPQAGDTCPEVLAGAAEPQQYLCVLCGREFRFEKNMLRHMQKAHAVGDDESVLKCKLCNYTTKHYSNMYVHIRTHTGDKPYWCSACGASFTQGSSLKLHIKSRHEDDMNFFSLNKKLGKNNLTKLWQRVLKKDIKSMSMIENMDMKSSLTSHNSSMGSLLGPYAAFNPSHSLFALLSQHSPFAFGPPPPSQQLPTTTSMPSGTMESSLGFQMDSTTNPITSAVAPLNLKMKSEPDVPDPHIASTASWTSFNAAASLPMPMLSANNNNMATPSKIKQERMPMTPCVEQAEIKNHPTEQSLPLNLSPNNLPTAHLPHWYYPTIQPFTQMMREPSIAAVSSTSSDWQKLMTASSPCNLVARADKCFQTDTRIVASAPEVDERYLNWENVVLKGQLERLRGNVKKLLLNIYPLDSSVKDEMTGSKVDECLEEAARLLQQHHNRDS